MSGHQGTTMNFCTAFFDYQSSPEPFLITPSNLKIVSRQPPVAAYIYRFEIERGGRASFDVLKKYTELKTILAVGNHSEMRDFIGAEDLVKRLE